MSERPGRWQRRGTAVRSYTIDLGTNATRDSTAADRRSGAPPRAAAAWRRLAPAPEPAPVQHRGAGKPRVSSASHSERGYERRLP